MNGVPTPHCRLNSNPVNRRRVLATTLGLAAGSLSGIRSGFAEHAPDASPVASLPDRLTALLDAYAENGAFSGSALIACPGQPVLRKSFGIADATEQLPNTPETGFQIASVTKTFTAALVMHLRDAGYLALDDPASQFLTGYPHLERDGVAVTIRQLLSHTAGVVDFLSLYDLGNPLGFPANLSLLLDDIKQQPLEFTPGSAYAYSNSGYLLLGQIVREITGQSWEAALAEYITAPLELTHTWLTPPADPGPQAFGYTQVGSMLIPVSRLGRADLAESAGGLTSTVDDLLIWDQALWSGRVLAPATVTEMATPVRDGYGLGLQQSRYGALTAIGHFGETVGYRSAFQHFPDLGATIILLANREDFALNTMIADLATELSR